MSFRCEICNKAQEAGVTPVVLITEQRRVTYPKKMDGKKVVDSGGVGMEIVSTVNACSQCANENNE